VQPGRIDHVTEPSAIEHGWYLELVRKFYDELEKANKRQP